jgi:large subunit ribosomal protein L6
MSRIGKLPIAVPKGVSVELSNDAVSVKGPKGNLSCAIPPFVNVAYADNQLTVTRHDDNQSSRAMHGLARTLVNNLVDGVCKGFSKSLEINGVGYAVEMKKLDGLNYLHFSLGYSHPIYFEIPEGLKINIDSKTKLTISGVDRQLVGSAAAKIRSFRPPEPYKGKGVKYVNEVIRRKEGKSSGR